MICSTCYNFKQALQRRILVKLFSVILFNLSFLSMFAQDWHDRYRALDIQKYTISIRVSDSSNVIYGRTRADIRFKEAVDSFVLDLDSPNERLTGMYVDSVIFAGNYTGCRHQNGSLVIGSGNIRAGDTVFCEIVYHGIPSDGLIIGNNLYGDRTFFGDNWPNRAHNWFPCIDHPSDKALVEFRITVPSQYQVIANGRLIEQTSLPNGQMYYNYATDVPLATKVSVIGIARFAVWNYGETENIPVSAWVYPQNRSAGFYDYAVTPSILTWFTNLLGPYPFSKLANVQSTTKYGGMENAGNIFYPEGSITGGRSNLLTMVHEISHMWFGNSAGEMDWPDFWLSEGFATYLTDMYVRDVRGEQSFRDRMKMEREAVISYALTREAAVVDTITNRYEELLNANSYEKGAWVLHMLRHKMGNELFIKGIKTYYEKYKYDNASTADLRKVLEEVSGTDLNSFFEQWLYSPGIPVLKFNIDQKRSQTLLTIEQLQNDPAAFSFSLDVKFVFPDGTNKNVTLEMNQKVQTFRYTFTKPPVKIIADPDVWLLFKMR